jgi:hypothetical protein
MTEPTTLRIEWDVRLQNHGNAGGGFSRKARLAASQRAREQRTFARNYLRGLFARSKRTPPLPATIRLTRLAPRELDSDNLAYAFKHYRDGIADAFGTDDGPRSPLQFEYAQERTKLERKPKVSKYAIRVEVIS